MISNFEKVKSNANIGNVLQQLGLTDIKSSGDEYRTDCPFTSHKSKNPFSINQTTGAWRCHACDKVYGSNIVNLVEKVKALSFSEAIDCVSEYNNATPTSFQPTSKVASLTRKISTSEERKYTSEQVIDCWKKASPVGDDDTYFKYKKLTPPNDAKFGKNPKGYASTLMPFQDIQGTFKGFVCLDVKNPLKYNFVVDNSIRFMLLGQLQHEGYFFIGEGVATVQTVWEATNKSMPAIAVGGWENMLSVLQEITTTYPNLKPIVLLDLDKKDKTKEVQNVNSKAICITPKFQNDNPNLKDFNDLLSKENQAMEVIKEQVKRAITSITSIESTHKTDIGNQQDEEWDRLEKEYAMGQYSDAIYEPQVIDQTPKETVVPAEKTELESQKTLVTADQLIQAQKERLEKYKGKEFLGLPQRTISTLDIMLLGLRKYMILAAAPNVGKTALAIQLAIDIVKNNENTCVLFLSFEMTRDEIMDRILCHLAKMTYKKLHFGSMKNGDKGWYTDIELKTLHEAKELLNTIGKKILIIDEEYESQISTKSILQHIDDFKKQTNSEHAMVIMDYLQVFSIPEDQAVKLRNDLDSDKYRATQMKILRQKLQNDPLIVISEARKPKESAKWADSMADLMGSSRTAYGADCISLLNLVSDDELEKEISLPKKNNDISIREQLKKQGLDIVRLTIAKGRDGMQKGSILLIFHFLENRFEETDWIKIANKIITTQTNPSSDKGDQPDYGSIWEKK